MSTQTLPDQLPKPTPESIGVEFIEAYTRPNIKPAFLDRALADIATEIKIEKLQELEARSAEILEETEAGSSLFRGYKMRAGLRKIELRHLYMEGKYHFGTGYGYDVQKVETDDGFEVKTEDEESQIELDLLYEAFRTYYAGFHNIDKLNSTRLGDLRVRVPVLPPQTSMLGLSERPKINAKRSKKKIGAEVVAAVYADDYYEVVTGPSVSIKGKDLEKKDQHIKDAKDALNIYSRKVASARRRRANAHDILYPNTIKRELPPRRRFETDEGYRGRLTAPQLETYAWRKFAGTVGLTALRERRDILTQDQYEALALEMWTKFKEQLAEENKRKEKTEVGRQLRLGDVS